MKCKPFDLKRRSHAQWYTSAILVPDKLRQKDHKFKASLGYRVRLYLKNIKLKKKNNNNNQTKPKPLQSVALSSLWTSECLEKNPQCTSRREVLRSWGESRWSASEYGARHSPKGKAVSRSLHSRCGCRTSCKGEQEHHMDSLPTPPPALCLECILFNEITTA